MSGRRCYDWKYWPVAIVILAMIIAGLSAKIAWGLETYWTLPPGSCVGHDCRVPVEGDLLAMDVFRNCLTLYQDDEKVIIVACVENAVELIDNGDGTNTASVALTTVKNTRYYIHFRYLNNRMQIGYSTDKVTITWGTTTDFAGSFNPGEDLTFLNSVEYQFLGSDTPNDPIAITTSVPPWEGL